MSETWRRKNYYRPRVLIGVDDTLNCPYPGGVLCLSGGALNVLKNLCEYAHRRSTFVSEYETDYYLAPTEEEWDALQALVSEMEGDLMSAESISEGLEAIAAQIACICQALQTNAVQGQPPDEGYVGQRYYDDYLSSVEYGEGDPPGGLATWDDWLDYVCVGSQKLVDDVGSTVLQIGSKWTAGLLIVFSVVNGILLLTVITAPVSIVIQVVVTFAALGVSMSYSEIAGWLSDHKQGIVCAMYHATTAGTAWAAVQSHIDNNWDAGPGVEMVKGLFSREAVSAVFDANMRRYAEWSSEYSPDYCDVCDAIPEGVDFIWQWPPCENGSHLDGGVCWEGRKCFNGSIAVAHQEHIVNIPAYGYQRMEVHWKSCFDTGWTVGQVNLERWNTVLEQWEGVTGTTCTNTVDAGETNTRIATDTVARDGGLHRTRLSGQPAQGQSEPYPFEVVYWRVQYSTDPF